MNKILLVSIMGLGLITTACNENEFSQSDALLKLENEQSSAGVVVEDDYRQEQSEIKESKGKEKEALEEKIDGVVENMIQDEVVDIIEPIEETLEDNSLAKTYDCKGKNNQGAVIKFMICHVPRGNVDRAKTLCLPKSAIKAHVAGAHQKQAIGYMGPCKKDI